MDRAARYYRTKNNIKIRKGDRQYEQIIDSRKNNLINNKRNKRISFNNYYRYITANLNFNKRSGI